MEMDLELVGSFERVRDVGIYLVLPQRMVR